MRPTAAGAPGAVGTPLLRRASPPSSRRPPTAVRPVRTGAAPARPGPPAGSATGRGRPPAGAATAPSPGAGAAGPRTRPAPPAILLPVLAVAPGAGRSRTPGR